MKRYLIDKRNGLKIDFNALPLYGKWDHDTHYGYLSLAHDNMVWFFYALDEYEVHCTNVSEFYDVID